MEQQNTPGAEGAPAASPTSELQPGHAAPPADGGVAQETQPVVEAQPQPDPEEEARARNRKEQRFSDLSRRANAAEREAAYWRGIAEERVRQNGPQPPQQTHPQAAQPQGRPDPNDTSRYPLGQFDERYIEDVADWKLDQREAARETERQRMELEAAEQRAFDEGRKLYDATLAAAERDGFYGAADLLRSLGQNPNARPVIDAINATHDPVNALRYLEAYPDELPGIARMTPMQRAARLGRIAEHVARRANTSPPPQSPPAPQPSPGSQPTNSLQATPTVNGRGAHPQFNPETAPVADFERRLAALRSGTG